MVATVIIQEWNSSATSTDKTSSTVRFKNANNHTVDNSDPLVIPGSGTDYSYEKWLRLRITGTPPSDNISSLNFYMDGANNFGTGVYLWGTRSTKLTTSIGEPNTGNRPPHANTTSGSVTMTDAFTFTSGAPLTLGGGSFSASSTNVGNFVVLVLEASAAATQGTLTAETATFEYDEI